MTAMPTISRFYGIVITMYYADHPPPHFHARYAGQKAQVTIDPPGVIAGNLPPRALALAVEWAVAHRQELLDNWQRAQARQPLQKIHPLQ
jgi:hypothetical protein